MRSRCPDGTFRAPRHSPAEPIGPGQSIYSSLR